MEKSFYPKLFNDDAKKTTKDKKRQNFRLIAEKYSLDKDNRLFIKLLNKNNQTKLKFLIYMKLKI